MKKVLATILTLIMISSIIPANAIEAKVRIMDLTHIKGVRENQLVGYGIVVGLPGTGDNSRSTQITNKMLLRNLGTVIEPKHRLLSFLHLLKLKQQHLFYPHFLRMEEQLQ